VSCRHELAPGEGKTSARFGTPIATSKADLSGGFKVEDGSMPKSPRRMCTAKDRHDFGVVITIGAGRDARASTRMDQ
jgi:hypothetical protein